MSYYLYLTLRLNSIHLVRSITFQENYGKQAALKIYRHTEHRYIVGTHYSTTGDFLRILLENE